MKRDQNPRGNKTTDIPPTSCREAWPTDPSKVADIQKDFLPGVGDRRQELVFIGIGVDVEALTSALDACLLTPDEMEVEEAGAAVKALQLDADEDEEEWRSIWDDPFLPWPSIQVRQKTAWVLKKQLDLGKNSLSCEKTA